MAIPGAEAARELPPVGAKAFARLDFSGEDLIDKARSRNVRRVQLVAAGILCFHLDATVKNVVASLLPGAGNTPSSCRSGSSHPTATSDARTAPTSTCTPETRPNP